MIRHLLVVVALGIFGLGACTSLGTAWPEGYRQAACAATDHLRGAVSELASAIDGIASGDAERVAIAAAGMEREADAAGSALGGAPAWGAGSQLIAELREAAADLTRAAAEFRVGARQGNGPELDRAVASGQDAEAGLVRAEAESARLSDEVDWQPC